MYICTTINVVSTHPRARSSSFRMFRRFSGDKSKRVKMSVTHADMRYHWQEEEATRMYHPHHIFYSSLVVSRILSQFNDFVASEFHDNEASINNLSSLHATFSSFNGVAVREDRVQTNEWCWLPMHSINNAATVLRQSREQHDDHYDFWFEYI